jgi:long-chain acyl-CoA synthetase
LAEALSRGVPADIDPTAYALIGDFFAANVDLTATRPPTACMGRTMTYGAFDRLSRAFASYLRSDC